MENLDHLPLPLPLPLPNQGWKNGAFGFCKASSLISGGGGGGGGLLFHFILSKIVSVK